MALEILSLQTNIMQYSSYNERETRQYYEKRVVSNIHAIGVISVNKSVKKANRSFAWIIHETENSSTSWPRFKNVRGLSAMVEMYTVHGDPFLRFSAGYY